MNYSSYPFRKTITINMYQQEEADLEILAHIRQCPQTELATAMVRAYLKEHQEEIQKFKELFGDGKEEEA